MTEYKTSVLLNHKKEFISDKMHNDLLCKNAKLKIIYDKMFGNGFITLVLGHTTFLGFVHLFPCLSKATFFSPDLNFYVFFFFFFFLDVQSLLLYLSSTWMLFTPLCSYVDCIFYLHQRDTQ